MNPAPHRSSVDVPAFDGLSQRAARLFPESEYLQREWRRAVAVVRKTRRGYLLDKPVPKQEKPQ